METDWVKTFVVGIWLIGMGCALFVLGLVIFIIKWMKGELE